MGNKGRCEFIQVLRLLEAMPLVVAADAAREAIRLSAFADPVLEGTELHGPFRSEFSVLRSTVAFHQASWPIVAIDLENLDYRQSAARLRETNAMFFAWMTTTLSGTI